MGAPQSLKTGMGTYLPAVQTAHKGEDLARRVLQLHVVAPQDQILKLPTLQSLRLGHIQATG